MSITIIGTSGRRETLKVDVSVFNSGKLRTMLLARNFPKSLTERVITLLYEEKKENITVKLARSNSKNRDLLIYF